MATFYWTGTTDGTWTNVNNWVESDGTAPSAPPGTGDSVVFDGRAVRALTGSPSGTIRLSSVEVRHAMAYSIGTPTSPISAAVDTFTVGEEPSDGSLGAGSPQICWNFGGALSGYNGTTVRVLRTNTTGTSGLETLQLRGTHASNKCFVEGAAVVGWGTSFPAQAYTLSQINVTHANARVTLGSGGTLTTVNQSGGIIVLNCACTTINNTGGTIRTEGSGAITTANIDGGTLIANSTGTISTLDVGNGGVADFSRTSRARTVTTATIHGTGRITAANGEARSVTFTNGVDCVDGASSSQVDFGTNVNVQQAAP